MMGPMVQIESAWPKYPDYEINLRHDGVIARAWFGDLLLAESEHAIRVEETKHVDRLYFPVDDVHWELFEPTLNFTVCPFKGAATYWSLTAVDPVEKDIVWTYTTPFDEVARHRGLRRLLPGARAHRARGALAGRRPRRRHHQPSSPRGVTPPTCCG